MDEARIRALVAELDAAVPREGARLRLTDSHPADDGSLVARGNAAGALRLGADLLAATVTAMDRAAEGSSAVGVLGLEAWVDSQSDWSTAAVMLADPLPPVPPAARRGLGDRLMLGGYAPLLFGLLVGAFALGVIVASR